MPELDDPRFVMGGMATKPGNMLDTIRGLSSRAPLAAVNYPIVIPDISSWQGVVDWPKMASQAQAVIIRAGYGNDGHDPQLVANVAGADAVGMEWGLYWFVKAGKDFRKHVESFHQVWRNYPGKITPVMDCEYTEYSRKLDTTNWLSKLVKNWYEVSGKDPMIYTRASWWDYNTYRTDWPKALDLHIAHYTIAAQPMIPADWAKVANPRSWTFWQYSADGNGQGSRFGAQSKAIDLNRWQADNGDTSIAAFNQRYGTDIKPILPPPPPPPPPPGEGLHFSVVVASLNVRSGPGTNYGIVGKLAAGDVVTPLDVAGQDAWVEVSPGKWAAVKINAAVFMKKI